MMPFMIQKVHGHFQESSQGIIFQPSLVIFFSNSTCVSPFSLCFFVLCILCMDSSFCFIFLLCLVVVDIFNVYFVSNYC